MTHRALVYGLTPIGMPENATVAEVLARMLEKQTNHIALNDDEGRFVGLVSARGLLGRIVPAAARVEHGLSDLMFAGDALPMLVSHFNDLKAMPAAAHAESRMDTLRTRTPLTETVFLLSRAKGPLPVLDDEDRLVGALTPRAMLAFLSGEPEAA